MTKNAIYFAENTPHFEEGAPCFDKAFHGTFKSILRS